MPAPISEPMRAATLNPWTRRERLLPLGIDAALVAFAWWFAYQLRFNFELPASLDGLVWMSALGVSVVYAVALGLSRVYSQVWHLTSLNEIKRLGLGVGAAGMVVACVALFLRELGLPRTVIVVHPLLCLVVMAAGRALSRSLSERIDTVVGAAPLLVLGGLDDAAAAIRSIKGSRQWVVAGIVSPKAADQSRSLGGVVVTGGFDGLSKLVASSGAKAVLISGARGSSTRHDALLAAGGLGVAVLTLPTPDDLLTDSSNAPRRIQLEDLLGRPSVALDEQGLSNLFAGQCVLVTGGGGSIGSELCRQLARFGVSHLVCVDLSEFALYQLEQELARAHPQMRLSCYTANVREFERLLAIAKQHQPSVVLHAAAYKHVPLMEQLNEIEALLTNALGTLHAARVAGLCGAKRFVQVSTDKAINPTNVMGASKRLAELVVQAVALEHTRIQYVSVRFGNVLGSSGSVVPLFSAQIERGGPVTVTHPDIVRYFMTIPEACRLVLQATLMGSSGQIFVLDMGDPVKIVELARMMIRLSGKTEADIPIQYSGLRPGEKLFEELLADDETTVATPHPKLRVAKTADRGQLDLAALQTGLASMGPMPQAQLVRDFLKSHVPEYAVQAAV